MSTARVRSLIETRLLAWAEENDIPVAIENMKFEPPKALHIETYLLPADTTSPDLANELKVWKGIWQMTIVEPNKVGTRGVADVLGQLQDLFPQNLRLSDSVITMQITTPISEQVGESEPNKYRLVTRFAYRADLA